MINHLKYKLDFTQGSSRSGESTFEKGSTLITGKNGRGKSLYLEMIAFLLFGSVALRGKAEDYSRIKASLDITIKNVPYKIERTKSGAKVLNDKSETLAEGNKPVNEWCIRTLGFSYDVYRISQLCAQGDIQALANMKPTERKKMVDSVAGLTQMDELIKVVSGTISNLNKGIATAQEYLHEPKPVVIPEIMPEDKCQEYLTQLNDEISNLNKEKYYLESYRVPNEPRPPMAVSAYVEPTKPRYVVPNETMIPEFSGVPEKFAEYNLNDLLTDLSQRLDNFQTISFELKSLDSYFARLDSKVRSLGDAPLDLAAITARNELIARAQAKRQLLSQGETTCPNCTTIHPIASSALEPYQDVDVSLADEQPMSRGLIAAHNDYLTKLARQNELNGSLDAREGTQQLFDEVQGIVTAQSKYDNAIAQHNHDVQQAEAYNRSIDSNHEANVEQSKQSYARQLESYDEAQVQYIKDKNAHEWAVIEHNKRSELWAETGNDELDNALQQQQAMNGALTQWAIYHNEQKRYEQDLVTYQAGNTKVEAEKATLQNYKRARDALSEIKSRVKSYILPSLNNVASYLLTEMTGGEYSMLVVDEDFEVFVDGQPLRTLSGSGKDIANLAIRIGLGRILTHSVLPVMMFDEIDAAMDDDRATYTWECIQKITPMIGQVLQVSHKHLSSQHVIEVL